MAVIGFFADSLGSFISSLNEGDSLSLVMTATIVDDGPTVENFPDPSLTLIGFDTPDGVSPIGGGSTMTYYNNSVTIPAEEYKWVIDNVETTVFKISDVPDQIDWLTACSPNPVTSKDFFITLSAESIGSLGTVLSAQQTYTISIRNGWDSDKAELAELLLRQTKV